MKIAIIGAGNMGGAIARGLARSAKDVTIAVSNPTTGKLDKLKAEFPAIETTTDNVAAANDADIIVIAVKPWLVEQVIKEIEPGAPQVLVSVAAGISTEELETMTGQPGITIFRAIPNTAISCILTHGTAAEGEHACLLPYSVVAGRQIPHKGTVFPCME